MKKALATILSVCMMVSMLVVPTLAADAGYSDSLVSSVNLANITNINDRGTANDVQADSARPIYKITDVAGLKKLAEISKSSSLVNNTFYLANSIGSEADPITDFAMIGTNSVRFAGRIDGLGNTIDYLTVSSTEDQVGLIRATGNYVGIKNLKLGANCVLSGKGKVGSVIGENTCTISYVTNVSSAATVKSTGSNCGGIVGFSLSGSNNSITNCTFSGSVSSGYAQAGGILGGVQNDYGTMKITDCRVDRAASVLASNIAAGGIVGKIAWSANIKISGCLNAAGVRANQGKVGGIVGEIDTSKAEISNCENQGTLTGRNNVGTGGIVGSISSAATSVSVNACVNHGTVTNTADTAADNKIVAGIVVNNAFASLSLTNCTNRGALKGEKQNAGILYGEAPATNTGNVDYSTKVQYEGYQVKTNTEGEKVVSQDIRFLATIDSSNYDRAGFSVTVKRGNEVLKTVTERDCQYAYQSVYALDANGNRITVDVENDGYRDGGYFIAYSITGIPMEYTEGVAMGALTFVIDTYTFHGDTKTEGEHFEVTHTVGAEK